MEDTAAPQTYRIATWNFLAGGSAKRTSHWEMVREHVRPDLLMTQESKALPRPRSDFGYTASRFREAIKGRWGTGLHATSGRIRRVDVAGFDGWVTGGFVRPPTWLSSRTVVAFSVHCPAGSVGYLRMMHRMIDALLELRGHSDLVLAGDFNVAAGFRGGDEAVAMSKAERAVLDRMVGELGLIPCWQHAHPGVPLTQTLRWSGNRAAPYHCDGIFVPRRWGRKLVSCDVISGSAWDVMSDHNPVVAVFGKPEKASM
jgi:exonuclease III